jgi:excisionase family DNA binding protein
MLFCLSRSKRSKLGSIAPQVDILNQFVHNMSMEDELLTIEQAAVLLQKHQNSVRRLLRQDKLPGQKVGGEWRIKRSALMAMFDGKKPPAHETPERKNGTEGD